MGKKASNIKIDINDREVKDKNGPFSVNTKTENYGNYGKFEKLTYTIKANNYKDGYNLLLHFNKSNDPFFTYSYPSSEKDKVVELCSIFSNDYKQRPLVIGFKGNEDYYYYIYNDLVYIKTGYIIDIDGINPFTDNSLKLRLKDEDDVIKKENTLNKNLVNGEGRIYLSNKGDSEPTYTVKIESKVTCSIDVTKEPYQGCKYIVKVTYKIIYFGDLKFNVWNSTRFKWSNSYYYLRFYTGTDISNAGRYLFVYYPEKNRNTIREVEAYCSLIYINEPFVLRCKTKEDKYFNSSFDNLAYIGYAYDSYFPKTTNELGGLITNSYSQKFQKISFKTGTGSNKNIETRQYEFSRRDKSKTKNKFRKVMFIAQKNRYTKESTIFSNNMLSLNQFKDECQSLLSRKPKPSKSWKITNKPIDQKTLNGLSETEQDGVVVCYTYPSEIALLVEFYTDCNTKHQFVRKDLDGDSWEKGQFEYDSDFSLAQYLEKIESEISTRITYRLDINSDYNDNKIKVSTNKEENDGYTVYTHSPTQSSRLESTKALYNCEEIQIVPNSNLVKGQYKLDKLNNIVFTEVRMYVIDSNQDDHLIMNLKENDKTYYLHRFSKDGSQWKQISLSELIELGLIDSNLLESLWKLNQDQELEKRIEKVLSKSDNCKKLLNHISYSFSSIIVLIDNKNQYGNYRITQLTKDGKEITPIDMSTIEVGIDTTDTTCRKMDEYSVYKHNLTSVGMTALEALGNTQLYIRLYSESKRIIVTEDNGDLFSPTCLTYDKQCNDLFVYFKNDGNKPLLVYYNGNAYGPKDGKDNRWSKIKDFTDCNSTELLKSHLNRISGLVKQPQSKSHALQGGGSGDTSNVQITGESGHSSSKKDKPQSENISSTPNSPDPSKTQQGGVPNAVQDSGPQAGDHTKTNRTSPDKHALSQGAESVSPGTKIKNGSPPNKKNEVHQNPIGGTLPNDSQHDSPSELTERHSDNSGRSRNQNNDDDFPEWAKGAAGAGGAGLIGSGVGGYFLYTKCIKPRRL